MPKRIHGMTGSREWNSWNSMRGRCSSVTNPNYPNYGGRGITVCDRWMDGSAGLINFLADMGPRPHGASLDRIDNNGNYEPTNCRWATPKQQRANQRPAKKYKGSRHFWSDDKVAELRNRFEAGQPHKEIAKAMGITVDAAQQARAVFGLPPRGKFWTSARMNELRAVWERGLSYREISDHLGATAKAIEVARHKFNLPPRARGYQVPR